jgi:hypothetical protein
VIGGCDRKIWNVTECCVLNGYENDQVNGYENDHANSYNELVTQKFLIE